MKITALLDNFNNIIQKIGQLDPEITNIEFDSRRVTDQTIFFALKGIHTDGHNYIEKAISLGAKAICHSDDILQFNSQVLYIKVNDTKTFLSEFSNAFYNYPSRELKIIGVTGTDGKSTTVSLIDQLLELSGEKSGYLSTISFKSGDVVEKNVLRQSTPEACQIHGILRDMVNNGKKYAVVESTSHGLSEKTSRLKDVDFNVGVLTNITQEHLEFHGSLDQYKSDKGNLFRKLNNSKKDNVFAVINFDDPECKNFIKYTGEKPVFTYSPENKEADLYATNIKLQPEFTKLTLNYKGKIYNTQLNLPGKFNIENMMAAILAVHNITGKAWDSLIALIPELTSVKGRLNPVPTTGNFSVVVDYAHTPGAFNSVLPTIKNIISGRLIVVFGSAGERDTVKRPIQGEIADKFADVIILTDEDPRLEDSMSIIQEIKAGIKTKTLNKNLFLIPDRKTAITKAIDIAKEGDMILTLGKGHESTMEFIHGSEPWNEIEIIEEILKSKGLF